MSVVRGEVGVVMLMSWEGPHCYHQMNAMMCGSASMDGSVLGMANGVVVCGGGSASRRWCGWWGGSVVCRKVSWGHG
jgi:hypothetical protein